MLTPEALAADCEIRSLGYRFSDAVNRNSVDDFLTLWAPEGSWIIDPPMGVAARGADALAKLFTELTGAWKFFHQIANQGPIFLEGENARARMYMHEIGLFKEGQTHRNWGEYTDVYRRVDDRWLYVERHYHFLYVDGPPMQPDLLGVATDL
jgi:ketosteroid isomerase-like protein